MILMKYTEVAFLTFKFYTITYTTVELKVVD